MMVSITSPLQSPKPAHEPSSSDSHAGTTNPVEPVAATSTRFRKDILFFSALILALAIGVFVRVHGTTGSVGGFDQFLYAAYVKRLAVQGVTGYPNIVAAYIAEQSHVKGAVLPPTRFLYIFCAHLWRLTSGMEPLASLRAVSCLFSCLMLGLSAAFTWRLAGRAAALGVTALMACAPTQIFMAKYALIDGFFAFWAIACLWSLWENLRHPNHPVWLTIHTLFLALLVMTKENSAFAYAGILAVLGFSHFAKQGRVTLRLFLCTGLGPLLGVTMLVLLTGGIDQLYETYRLLVQSAYQLTYAIQTGDGPWYRYLVDLMLVSPVVLMLAITNILQVSARTKPQTYLSVFLIATYLVMANVKYGMNLRYANTWDMPLRFLAYSQLAALCERSGRNKMLLLALSICFICAFELHQYQGFFVDHKLSELVPEMLLRAVNILK